MVASTAPSPKADLLERHPVLPPGDERGDALLCHSSLASNPGEPVLNSDDSESLVARPQPCCGCQLVAAKRCAST